MNRDFCGFSLSFFLHSFIVGACVYLLPALDLQPRPMVIDFSLIPGASFMKSDPAPPERKQFLEPPPIVQAPPKPQPLEPPRPIKKVLPKTAPKLKAIPEKLSRPVERILPKKEEKPARAESPEDHVEYAAQSEPAVPVPEPVVHPSASSQKTFAPPTPVVSRQEMENHYVRAHFIYIKKIIEKNISYPPMARRMGWQGKVVVSFIVCDNGKVEDLQVVESSGYTQLDMNALETVRQVEPFPSPPVRVKLVLPVTYKIS